MLGMGELVVILLIILLLFGAAKLPEIAKALEKSIKEFKKASENIKKTSYYNLPNMEIYLRGAQDQREEVYIDIRVCPEKEDMRLFLYSFWLRH